MGHMKVLVLIFKNSPHRGGAFKRSVALLDYTSRGRGERKDFNCSFCTKEEEGDHLFYIEVQ